METGASQDQVRADVNTSIIQNPDIEFFLIYAKRSLIKTLKNGACV